MVLRGFGGMKIAHIASCIQISSSVEQCFSESEELELEIEIPGDGALPYVEVFHLHHLHVRCFAAWEFERVRVAAGDR